MNTKNQTTNNETDKPQWWQRLSRLFRRVQKLSAPRWTGLTVQHSELVVRHFPLTIGRALHVPHK